MTESLRIYLKEPVLFARNLPSTITYDHLRIMFKNLLVTRITFSTGDLICTKQGWSPSLLLSGSQTAKIEFSNIAEAERAFMKMHFRPIPNTFPPEILKLSAYPNAETPDLPSHLGVDNHQSRRRMLLAPKADDPQHTPVPSPNTGVFHTSFRDYSNGRSEVQRPHLSLGKQLDRQRLQVTRQVTPRLDTLQEQETRVESLLKQAEIDRDHWRHKFNLSQSRVKALEFQIEEERKKAAKEMASQKEAADRVAQEQARKDKLVAEIERCRQRDARFCKWDQFTAKARFLLVLDEFEARKPGTHLLTFEGIPWPTLDNPMVSSYQAEPITWEKVEAFFSCVKYIMPYDEYSKLVEKVHRSFHPDRWRARRVLDAIPDIVLRRSVEKSVIIVAQAMTPLWEKSKGRR